MTFTFAMTVSNAVMSFAVTVLMAFALIRFGKVLNATQRLGCGLMGGCAFLTIPPIMASGSAMETPFDGWAGFLLRVGILLYFAGAMMRMYGHEWANAEARRQAEEYMARNGRRADRALPPEMRPRPLLKGDKHDD